MTFSFIHKAYYLIGFFCLFTSILFGQNQKEADSLIILYESGSFQGDELELLKRIAEAETNPERVIEDAIKGMLPKNKLGKSMVKKLKVFPGSEHDHESQQPIEWNPEL